VKTKRYLLIGFVFSLCALPAWAGGDRYLHTHKGTEAQARNTDTNFGSPADYDKDNHYRKKYEIRLSGSGVDTPQKLTVSRRAIANFDVRNVSDQDLTLLIGDDRAIAEFIQLLASGGSDSLADFHTRKLPAGQTLQFAWRFDTFATQKVKFVVVGSDGKPADKVLNIQVGPLEDRNYRLEGR
jgi:hypothetical protein